MEKMGTFATFPRHGGNIYESKSGYLLNFNLESLYLSLNEIHISTLQIFHCVE